jgi:hypothetical protein
MAGAEIWVHKLGLPSQKQVETMEAPQNRRFYGKMERLPIRPTCIGEKGRTLGKTYYYEVILRTFLGNTLGT